MSGVIFGMTAGFVVAVAGTNVIEQPLKAVALIAALVTAHFIAGGGAS